MSLRRSRLIQMISARDKIVNQPDRNDYFKDTNLPLVSHVIMENQEKRAENIKIIQ